jgi:hypothetical protein
MQETLREKLVSILFPLLCHHGTRSELEILLHFIEGLTMSQKKQLITLARSANIPSGDTTLYHKTQSLLDVVPQRIMSFLTNIVSDTTTCGILISLCISMPIPQQEVKKQFDDMLSKEMKVMESTPLQNSLNFDCFFGDYSRPLHVDIRPNPRMASAIHKMIDNWIEELKEKPIYPHMTSKLVSKPTQRMVSDLFPDYIPFEEEGCSQFDLEYLYHRYGSKVDGGPCEVKQRWYPSGLNPRTYYAAGSDAYHLSKYLRHAFNRLCDHLPPTERYARVNPRRLHLKAEDHHALIYDLTSFTSNMHEQRHFMDRLSLYCRGHNVTIMDTTEGLIDFDLGDLIFEYNRLNIEPKYASDNLLPKSLELSHHTAGFLGVFGNLATCTFLHGAVMSQLVDDFSQLGIAGDDGIIDSEDDYDTILAIRLLGLMELSKGYSTSDEGNQIYLKRPIWQVGQRLYTEQIAIFSMFEHLGDADDSRFFPKHRSKKERRSALASSIVAYLRSLSRIELTQEQKERAYHFLCEIYRIVGFPISGYLSQLSTEVSQSYPNLPATLIPTLREDFIGMNPIEITIKSTYTGVVVLPETVSETIEYDKGNLYSGMEFECTMNPEISLLSRLGYVELESREVTYCDEFGLQMALKYMTTTSHKVLYQANVLNDIPDFLIV